jgi:hypothetical protein
MRLDEVGEFKEALDYREANLAIEQGWKVMAVVPRGTMTIYVLGKPAESSPGVLDAAD